MPPTSTFEQTEFRFAPGEMRAQFSPSSYDEEKRTVEVVAATEFAVTRHRYTRFGDVEAYDEILPVDEKTVDLSRLNNGASVLNNHRSWGGVSDVIGRVERAWIAGGELRCVLRLSSREDVLPIVQDIRDGILSHVSIGYKVEGYEDVTQEKDPRKQLRAKRWSAYEVSFVGIPADPNAGVRSASQKELYIVPVETREEKTMPPEATGAQIEENRSHETNPAPPVDVEAVRREARAAERARVSEIREHCRAFHLPEAEIDTLVDTGRSLAELTSEVRDAYVRSHNERTNGDVQINGRLHVVAEEIDKKRAAISHAISARMGVSESAKEDLGELRGRSLIDLMRFSIAAREGERAALRMSTDAVIKRALHTTSDFPVLLQESGRRTLRDAYATAPTTYQMFTRPGTLQDFRPTKRVQLGDAPAMELVPEAGDIKYGTLGESAEQIALASYGKGVTLTRQAIWNDDLAAFARLIGHQARQVALLVENLAYAQLTGGTVGGSSIYSTSSPNRANYIEGAGALSVLTADADGIKALNRLATLMQSQTSAEGDFLNLSPRYLIVPTTLGVVAQQLVAPIQATSQKDVNVWRGRIDVIENPRLNTAAAAWYLAADPNMMDTIEVAWLAGHEGPQFDMESDFDSRGIKFSCWAEFAAKAIDFRGLAKSKGAA